jgi:hypothetical protein
MGYRSDVAYKIQFEDKDQWNVFLIEAKSKPETRECFEDEDLKVDHENCEIKFLAQAVKWYGEYPDVKCHNALLELVDEYNDRNEERYVANYLFRRIGESDDDCEEMSGGEPDWDDIYLRRELVVSW